MTNNEMLVAISSMLEPITEGVHNLNLKMTQMDGEIKEIKGDIRIMKQDIAELKEDVVILKTEVAELKEDVAVLKKDVAILKKEVNVLKKDVTVLKAKVFDLEVGGKELKDKNDSLEAIIKRMDLRDENIILPRLNEIEKCYLTTYERYKQNTDEYELMKRDVSLLKSVVAEHSAKIYSIS